jgi:thiazole synthase ThiGH ThiG subunit
MTYDEALEFFANYGNVARDLDRLRDSVATEGQLNAAVAVASGNQPTELAEEAKRAILAHYAKLEDPKDQSVLRPDTVERMLELWGRGEAFTFPYTKAELDAAQRRWIDEGRSCPTVPKRVPWTTKRGVRE